MEYRRYLLEISKGSFVTGLCDALHGLHLRSCVFQGQLATNNGLHFVRSAITQMNYMYTGAPYWSSTVKTLLGDPHQTGHSFFKGSSLGTLASAQTIVKLAHPFPWLFLTFPINLFGGVKAKTFARCLFPKITHTHTAIFVFQIPLA